MPDIQTKFGNRLRELRKQKSLSQEDLAFKSGLHRTYISDIERGSRNLSIKNIEKIAKALGLQPKALFD
ncbi:MAG: transcriptional regulator [Candidatus Magasanikbacteria bacterium RIFOXYD2_FULL_41_14]|uniref:Transcriptional regulator n=1 Tax=Candidatus Magasanikbacteria bacterium RIFOXYD2_FULL_41_14 TaxID=1798709 RepID=A0A1F6PDZ7_9BACT|nr:MAG: transcriptional regulator [Candidatus Magasanikbacteria bacterium RIFOXYD2_FULL_41_14]